MKNKRNILIIILVAIIIISIYFLNNWSKSNSYHLRTYVEQEQKTKGADGIISLSKKGIAYIHWKIWYSDNREGVYISAGSNNKTIVNITEFESLPRD